MIGPAFPTVLSAAAGGDEDAFGRLYRELQPGLLRYLAVIAPGAAEDLAAETWLGVVGGIGRFRGSEPAFRAWVFTIARHQVIDWRRRAARRPTQDLPMTGLVDLAAPDDPATLPAAQAEAIVLRVVAGLDVGRVAAIMGKDPGSVRVLTHRGLRQLAKRLGADLRVRAGVSARWALIQQ
jgi:RNA polymerase sigma-70 factor, ECF subfamily